MGIGNPIDWIGTDMEVGSWYIREDIPNRELQKHNFTKTVEGLFIEVNLRKKQTHSFWYLPS